MNQVARLNYRMDDRDIKDFARDIEHGSRVEREIIELYVDYWQRKTGEVLSIQNNGCDNSGRLLLGANVNLKADYLLNGRPVEVKFNNSNLSTFRFKSDQLNSYMKQGASVIWVNGWQTSIPVFTVLKPKHLRLIKESKTPLPFIFWGSKLCYELSASDYTWTALKEGGKE
ncbi:hypothetical protein [Heliobacterium mobile]